LGDDTSFGKAGGNEADLSFDVIAILSPAHLPTSGTVDLLESARHWIRSCGRLLVSGPTSAGSAASIQGQILRHLEADGGLPGIQTHLQALGELTGSLRSGPGYTSSAEGMAALLRHLGFIRILEAANDLYEGASYLVVAAAT
jgi:hypothetical protein